MRFRTKPFEIEAEQYKGTQQDLERLLKMISENHPNGFAPVITGSGTAVNEEGVTLYPISVFDYLQDVWVPVNFGDYIIKGMKGEYYPCDPEVFMAKYEPVPPTTTTFLNQGDYVIRGDAIVSGKVDYLEERDDNTDE